MKVQKISVRAARDTRNVILHLKFDLTDAGENFLLRAFKNHFSMSATSLINQDEAVSSVVPEILINEFELSGDLDKIVKLLRESFAEISQEGVEQFDKNFYITVKKVQ